MSSWTSIILSYCAPPPDICQINLGQIFASYNISHSLLQQIFVLQHFSVVVTTNIWFSHCYNLFALLQGLCVVTILLQRIHVVTILIQHIACNCYNLFDKPCNNGIFWLLQAFQTPAEAGFVFKGIHNSSGRTGHCQGNARCICLVHLSKSLGTQIFCPLTCNTRVY